MPLGVGVLVPLPGFATEHVEIQRASVSGQPAVGSVLAHGLAICAILPRAGLPSCGRVGSVLRHPQSALGPHIGGNLPNRGCLHVDYGPHAGHRVHAPDEFSYPVAVAPCAVLVGFPIQYQHRAAHVRSRVVGEVVGFGGGVVTAGVVVEAEFLAGVQRALCLYTPCGVDEPGVLGDLGHGEVGLHLACDAGRLPAGHVDAVHVHHRGWHDHDHDQQRHQQRGYSFEYSGHMLSFRRRCASTGLIPRRGGACSACA